MATTTIQFAYFSFGKCIDALTVELPITSHFALAPSYQSMGCFLNKVASSSLVSTFLALNGLGSIEEDSPHRYVMRLQPRVT